MPNCDHQYYAPWLSGGLLLFVLVLSGCAQDNHQAKISQLPASDMKSSKASADQTSPALREPEPEQTMNSRALPGPDDSSSIDKGRSSEGCYGLSSTGARQKKIKGQRCEPQSLPFARCRSEINSCRLGWNNGPLTWFACEKQRGNTSPIPSPSSVLILAANKHKMPTGHVAYIEDLIAAEPPLYRLTFSHTNYDRQCSLETNIEAEYNSSTRTLHILTGAWKDWGKNLPVSGFILR